MLADRISALPGVEQVVASEENGSPEGAWGDRFFFVGPDRRQPFATIVEHDVPGFDEAAQLDRPGVFRLNLDLGRAEFERLFGFSPKDVRGAPRVRLRPAGHSHAAPGLRAARLRQHRHARARSCCPEIDRLLAVAHARAVERHERATRRATDQRN